LAEAEQWEDLCWATNTLAGIGGDSLGIAAHICQTIAILGASATLRQAAGQALAGVSGRLH
jgi:hypothetical protein